MAYSDFQDLNQLKQTLGIGFKLSDFFHQAQIPPYPPSESLTQRLERASLLPTFISEKARSEFIITPILEEIWANNMQTISLFSGVSFDIDKNLGLNGVCDFLIQKGRFSLTIETPILCLVEIKSKDLYQGIAQCAAEMYAAQLLHQREQQPIHTIYGCVSNANEWHFLRLENQTLFIDTKPFYLDNVSAIIGVFDWIIKKGQP